MRFFTSSYTETPDLVPLLYLCFFSEDGRTDGEGKRFFFQQSFLVVVIVVGRRIYLFECNENR